MKKGRLLANAYLVLVFGFLYVPIAVLIAFSFNESKSRTVFTGFTFKWYQNLFHNDMVLKSLGVSLGVAFAAACIATVVGTLAAIGISSMNKRARKKQAQKAFFCLQDMLHRLPSSARAALRRRRSFAESTALAARMMVKITTNMMAESALISGLTFFFVML